MKKEDIKNKEDLVNFILTDLYKRIHPVKFGDYFMELSLPGGIDSFRGLLEELHENKLLTKTSEYGEEVLGLAGYRTVDIKFTISLAGIKYLREIGLATSTTKSIYKKEVFVSYCWGNDSFNEKVISFTNFLRRHGFDAEMDKNYTQRETAIDFYKMMHRAMTDYEKVIVVLSEAYKKKAESFKGGVGNEYGLILKDIEEHPNKYILVAFEPYRDAIAPLQFIGRQVINVSDKNNMNELFAKLKSEETIKFDKVAEKKPSIEVKQITKFDFHQDTSIQPAQISINKNNVTFSGIYRNAFDILNAIDLSTKITESEFYGLIKQFEREYLVDRDYFSRLERHRYPANVRNETLSELDKYLLEIQNRREMRDIDEEKGIYGYVPSRIAALWIADKRLKTMYNSLKMYCSMRSKDFNIVAVHSAEYRALSKLFRKIDRSIKQSVSNTTPNGIAIISPI